MRLSRWLFGKRQGAYTGILLGLDNGGKTTLLYRLKLDQDVQAIPTIGFNVETIEHREGAYELWDIGGCDQMRRLVGNYIKENSFIIFVYDCSENERLEEALIELQSNMQMMREAGARHLWVLLNKQDLVPPGERHQVLTEIRQRFQALISIDSGELVATVVDSPGLSAKLGTQLKETMNAIQERLAAELPTSKPDLSSSLEQREAPPEANKGINQQELISQIQKLNNNAANADTFWAAFTSGQLEMWDHYNHLRAGYFVLLESLTSGKGVTACSDAFIEHLERLHAYNPQRFRNTTHQTMTMFWVVQLWYYTKTYQTIYLIDNLPQREDFGTMLLRSPSLLDSQRWNQFYPKELMFSPEAKASWCPPTLRPLPAILQLPRDIKEVDNTATLSAESSRLLEFGFNVARNILQSSARRGIIIKEALDSLHMSTIQVRARDPAIAPYSETQAYFWVQMAHAALRSVHGNDTNLAAMEFSQYVKDFRFTETSWRQYYSTELWESIPARMSFVNPDLKPLPNIIQVDPSR